MQEYLGLPTPPRRFALALIALAACGAQSRADDNAAAALAGHTLTGWTTLDDLPVTKGWLADQGEIRLDRQMGRAGHIITKDEIGDFNLSFEWKIAPRGNSGLKYRVRTFGGQVLGCEYQICDEAENRPLDKKSAGALYDLYEPATDRSLNPAGDWNQARIVVSDQTIEHWLNGHQIVKAIVGDDEWKKRIELSKFSDAAQFGENRRGRLMLTDHGSDVAYRNFVLKQSKPDKPEPREAPRRP